MRAERGCSRQERREVQRHNRFRKMWSRTRLITRHHLTPRSRGGNDTEENILMLEKSRHEAWHFLWGVKTLDEVIATLQRMKSMKGWNDETTHR